MSVSTPAPASGPVRRVNTVPVAKPTNSAALFIMWPNMASPAQTAKASPAQNTVIPSHAHPHRSGWANSSQMRRTDSRKLPRMPRQPGCSLVRRRYRCAAQNAMRKPGTGATAHGIVKLGGMGGPARSTAIAVAQPPMDSSPYSRPARALTRTRASARSAPAASRAYWSRLPPPCARKPPNPATAAARRWPRGISCPLATATIPR